MKILPFIIFSILLFSCSTEDSENKTIHPFDRVNTEDESEPTKPVNLFEINWLVGNWIDSTSFPSQVIVENWSLVTDTLIGKRGAIKNGITTFSQTSKIFINNSKPVYLLEPEGSSFVSFRAVEFSKDKISFKNVANLSPTQITYSKNKLSMNQELIFITPAGDRKFTHTFINY